MAAAVHALRLKLSQALEQKAAILLYPKGRKLELELEAKAASARRALGAWGARQRLALAKLAHDRLPPPGLAACGGLYAVVLRVAELLETREASVGARPAALSCPR